MDFVMVNRLDPGDDEHRENLIKYISDNRKLAIGGNGVDYHDPENALAQMQAVTDYFDKSHRCNGVQMIVAFDDHVQDQETAIGYMQRISQKIHDEFQNVYCVHEKDREVGTFHGYILINPVSAKDGKQLDTSKKAMNPICEEIREITGNENRLIFKRKS